MTEAATTDGMPASERSSGRKRATADYGTRVIDDLTGVAEHRWQALVEASGCGGPHGSSGAVAAAPLADDEDDPAVGGLPFIDWRYLTALEQTGCVGGRSGWAANHLLVERNGELVAAAPLYRKLHSYGEYVFDWAWADAYQRHGLDYYPKGLVASPFTPVPGPRLLAVDDAARDRLLAALVDHAREQQWSSLHLLFPPRAEAAATRRAGWLERRGVQFHWRNPGYRDFDDFLSRLAQPKRKKILAERRKVREAGIRISCHEGPTISAPHWLLFNRCYRTTYALHHSTPYLNRAFFERIGRTMPEHLVMFIAHDESNGEPVAARWRVRQEVRGDRGGVIREYWRRTRNVWFRERHLHQPRIVHELRKRSDLIAQSGVDAVVDRVGAEEDREPGQDAVRQTQAMDAVLTLKKVSGIECAVEKNCMMAPMMETYAFPGCCGVRQHNPAVGIVPKSSKLGFPGENTTPAQRRPRAERRHGS